MKSESLIVVVALLLIGMMIVKDVTSHKSQIVNKTKTQNNAEYQNTLETENTVENIINSVDISAIEELKNEENN